MIIDKTIDELTFFFRKTGVTVYHLLFFPTKVFVSLESGRTTRYVRPNVLFFISCFLYLIMQTSNISRQDFATKTSFDRIINNAKLQGNISEVEKLFFLVMVFTMVYLVLVVFSIIFRLRVRQKKLFQALSFYYISLHLLIYLTIYLAHSFYYDKLSILLVDANILTIEMQGIFQTVNHYTVIILPYIVAPLIYVYIATKNLFSNKILYFKYLAASIILAFSVDFIYHVYQYSFIVIYSNKKQVLIKNTFKFGRYELIDNEFTPYFETDTSEVTKKGLKLKIYIYNPTETPITIPKGDILAFRPITLKEFSVKRDGFFNRKDNDSEISKGFIFKAIEFEASAEYIIIKPNESALVKFKYQQLDDPNMDSIKKILSQPTYMESNLAYFLPTDTFLGESENWLKKNAKQPIFFPPVAIPRNFDRVYISSKSAGE